MNYPINLFKIIPIIFGLVLVLLGLHYTTNITQAAPTTYWFNNAVNTNPATLGNYWLNAGLTTPATELPDLNEDVVNIVSGVTYNGDAILRGSASNEGTVTGNATFYDFASNNGTVNGNGIFYEDTAENYGTINGSSIRRYTSAAYVERDFLSDGPWTIVAVGAEVTVEASQFNSTTTFQRESGGYFISFTSPETPASLAFDNKINLFYPNHLDTDFVPSTSDFSVTVNGSSVSVTSLTVFDYKVVLTLTSSVSPGDTVLVSYTIGSVALISAVAPGLNGDPFSNLALLTLPHINGSVADAPVYGALVGTKLYISNNHSSSVSVIDTVTNNFMYGIPVESYPEFLVLVGKKLYVNNLHSDVVSVIDTTTDTVINTITVGNGPYFSTVVGTKIYISNTDTNTVSVINTLTDTVTATITVGSSPWYGASVGTKLYIPNRTSNSVSVINTVTDTVITTIATTVNAQGTRAVAVDTKVFVGGTTTMSVINTLTDTVAATINVGTGPYFSCSYGTKLYVPNRGSSSVSVINTSTNSVITTIPTTQGSPTTCVVVDSRIYITRDGNSNNTINVIDTGTDSIVQNITVGNKPFYATPVGDRLYTSNNFSDNFSVIETTAITSLLPNLLSFTTPNANGVYRQGDTLEIRANFGQPLQPGSTMTVQLNSGASVTLNSISASSLYGHYTVGVGQSSPDLSVSSITSASVTNTSGQTRTSYSIPRYQPSDPALQAENSFITRDLGDSANIVIDSYLNIPVGSKPYQISSPITIDGVKYAYIANQGSATVSILRLSDQSVIATIPVGLEPYGLTSVVVSGITYVYVANTGSDTVSVINTATNQVVATVAVGVRPYYVAAVGSTIYVTNSLSNTVSAINTTSNTVSATIPVGVYPRGLKAIGTSLYVANYGDPNYSGGNSISVINTATNTVSTTIISPAGSEGARGLNVLGTKVYVANFRSNNVSVIDSASDTITHTINVGRGPRGVMGLGNKVYVENFEDGTISVIDADTNTVTSTLTIGHSPAGLMADGTDIYLTRFQDNAVAILNSSSNTLRPAAPAISGIATAIVNNTSIRVNWNTDTSTTALLEYGLTSEYGNSINSGTLATSTSLTLENLQAGRTYYFRITATDAQGTVSRSANLTFNTPGGGGIVGNHNINPSVSEPAGDILEDDNIKPDIVRPELITIPEKILQVTKNILCPEWSRLTPTPIQNATLFDSVVGRFLLATEDRGRLWYIDPISRYRYKVTQSTALCLFESVSLGITQANINTIPEDSTNRQPTRLGERLQGRFLINTEDKGQTWYVDQSGLRHKVGISNLVSLATRFALGITNVNLSLLPIGGE